MYKAIFFETSTKVDIVEISIPNLKRIQDLFEGCRV